MRIRTLLLVMLVSCLVGILPVATWAWASNESPQVELEVANPYRFPVQVEVKCDWNEQQKRFGFHRFFRFKSKQITVFKIPSHYRHCQVWPHVEW